MNSRTLFALSGSLLLGLAGLVQADATSSDADLKAELATLKTRIAQLEGQQSQNWLNERRAEEVKALVREVLADADTRASLLENGLTAGHNGKNFFLASEDGNFLMNVTGQMQVRYIANFREEQVVDENEAGFQIRRAKLQFDGHVGSPSILYTLRLASDRDDNGVYAEEVTVGYRVMDTLVVRGGRAKAPFLREELTSSKYQLAVERSYVNEAFTTGYVEGIFATWDVMDAVRLSGSLNDGAGSGETPDDDLNGNGEFTNDSVDFALTGRVDVKVAGDWDQMKDFSAWSGEELGVFLGGAVHYEVDETGTTAFNNDKTFGWTIDGSVEVAGFNAFAALIGSHDVNGDTSDSYGFVAQAGYMVIPDKLEPFIRFEYFDVDDDEEVQAFTFGANYYINKHSAKFTVDVIWAEDSIPAAATGLGLLADNPDREDQIAVRAQFQLLF